VRTPLPINKAASVGLSNRFDIQRDVDYRSFKSNSVVPWTEALQILWLSCKKALPSGVVRAIPSTGWCSAASALPLKVKQFFVWAAWLLAFQIIGPRTENRFNFNAFG